MDLQKLIDRMKRASRLEPELYEEVEADTGAMNEAATVVILSSLAVGIGSIGQLGVKGIVFGTVGALVGWLIWAYLTYIIGTQLLPVPQTESDLGETLRTIGYSSSPGVLRIFSFLPGLGQLINIGVSIWMLVAMVIAVRQALDYESTGRAVGVCAIGWLIQLLALSLFFMI